jgi:2-phosphosulfolactate phosphatase
MKSKITLSLRYDDIDRGGYLSETVVVLIDVLGSTSIISHALQAGAPAVHVQHDAVGATWYAQALDAQALCLACTPLDQRTDTRTQPLILTMPPLDGRQLVISSSHGYAAIRMASSARHVYAAALLNAPAIIRQLQRHTDLSICFACIKPSGGISLIDLYAAGYMISQLDAQSPGPWGLGDSAQLALAVYQRYQANPLDCLKNGHVTKRLDNDSFYQATHYVTRVGAHENVPEQRDPWVFSDIGAPASRGSHVFAKRA